MYRTALLLLAASATLAVNVKPREVYEKLFFEHMQTYGLHFTDGQEFASRIQIFADKVDLIEAHNADTKQTFQMGLNQFSHLTLDEFREVTKAGNL